MTALPLRRMSRSQLNREARRVGIEPTSMGDPELIRAIRAGREQEVEREAESLLTPAARSRPSTYEPAVVARLCPTCPECQAPTIARLPERRFMEDHRYIECPNGHVWRLLAVRELGQ